MLQPAASVLVRPGRDRLVGTVEVDETYISGEEPGLRPAGGARRPWWASSKRGKQPGGSGAPSRVQLPFSSLVTIRARHCVGL